MQYSFDQIPIQPLDLAATDYNILHILVLNYTQLISVT